MLSTQQLTDNIDRIEERIQKALSRAGRRREDVRLMAVTKTFPREYVDLAAACGLTLFGENRVQELTEKFATKVPGWELHLIGHLQSNKAKPAVETADCIQSLDKFSTAMAVNKHAAELGKICNVLVQVNTSGEGSKFGLKENDDSYGFIESLAELENLRLTGLMTLGPFTTDTRLSRRAFRRLRELFEGIQSRFNPEGFHVLSMGMSMDFETAIEEGATLIRLGTALFGGR